MPLTPILPGDPPPTKHPDHHATYHERTISKIACDRVRSSSASHTWTIDASANILCPALDLVPGRRCLCGCFVIIDDDPRNTPGDSCAVAALGSVAAEAWAELHPALKTW